MYILRLRSAHVLTAHFCFVKGVNNSALKKSFFTVNDSETQQIHQQTNNDQYYTGNNNSFESCRKSKVTEIYRTYETSFYIPQNGENFALNRITFVFTVSTT